MSLVVWRDIQALHKFVASVLGHDWAIEEEIQLFALQKTECFQNPLN